MRKLFGTDGVRGVANLDPMTSEMAMQLGRAAAHILCDERGAIRSSSVKTPVFPDICWSLP